MNAPRSTQAKSMHFATLIPDWNSLDSVRRAHSDLEAAALVFFALLVLFDILAHLSTDDKKKTLLEKIGLACFAIAVVAEVVAYPYGQRNDTLSGQVIGSLDAETGEALIKSGTALTQSKEAETKSGDALEKARKAERSLGKAEDEAKTAQSAASNALIISKDASQIAHDARREADSFEKDIVSAKRLAADAESHLAEALQKAADATAELNRLKSPRMLSSVSALVAALQPFKGTEYAFAGVFSDQESIDLLRQIDSALQLAGWTRTKLPPSGNADISLKALPNVDIPMSVLSGVSVKSQSSEKLEVLQKTPQFLLPSPLQGAIVLKMGLASGISPTQEDLTRSLEVGPGTANTVFIIVGKKP